ncbi:hypothetical protein AGDE_14540 [Angomonas deanei]|uniref:Tetratricopeptide repeat, putative n=1 Tax=Angomonas deanei TaxID=59799 RepID=A0A7G2CA26_9TRYP|nr:hypothetical protein AGDE_14540 [Angomonas deanei]CAD2216409.1 Tetratricopeptide repeat, putative [Angomonas deanei]|eukprot:EPY20683.1 hypothetical protein AGDE_14540 [Angomonas deanei]
MSVEECIKEATQLVQAGSLLEAKAFLEKALSTLENERNGLSGEGRKMYNPEENNQKTARVFRELGKIDLLSGKCAEALKMFELSSEAEPLTPECYVLRGSCYEKLGLMGEAFREYEKYIKLCKPSLEVLIHCGKCAVEAGELDAAESYLTRVLDAVHASNGSSGGDMSIYESHANFYLGYICIQRSRKENVSGPQAQALVERADEYFTLPRSDAPYLASYEANTAEAIEGGHYEVALSLLNSLCYLRPDDAHNYLRLAHVYHLKGDSENEWKALSKALLRFQGNSARRATHLARGMVFAEKVGDLERAIKDFTLVIDMEPDEEMDRCTPIAYLQRGETFRRRASTGTAKADDHQAALSDFKMFVDSVEQIKKAENCDDSAICDPNCITDTIITLASGAFHQSLFCEAARYFSIAISRGWEPIAPHVALREEGRRTVHDEVYLSLAHFVVSQYPVSEEIFKATYDGREWTNFDFKKQKTMERKDLDKGGFVCPSLSYLLVDSRYTALRALEPTVFTSLEMQLLDLWEPYRVEVEKVRDEMSTKSGRRGKRY